MDDDRASLESFKRPRRNPGEGTNVRRLLLLLLLLPCLLADAQRGPFVIAPYLQLGDSRSGQSLEVWWGARPGSPFEVRYQVAGQSRTATPEAQALKGYHLYHARLEGLSGEVDYQVVQDGKSLFSARARAPRPPGSTARFVVVGDTACGTSWEKEVAYHMHRQKPDCGVILGDIVYESGRQSEYLQHFFPIYNAPSADPARGAPLLRSTLFLAVPGNHDLRTPRQDRPYTDGYAYFLFWSLPLNGPETGWPVFQPASGRSAFQELAGKRYPRMASYSVSYGDVHWTMLDSSPKVDWTRPELRKWLAQDLAAASGASWRIVALHHSPFSSGHHHFDEQHTRVLADVFEKGGVDVVMSGHMHNYQRTRPLRFSGASRQGDGTVSGNFNLDRAFDGQKVTRPQGVLYVISGGGGAYLHDTGRVHLEPYTARMESNQHSFTVLDASAKRLSFKQIANSGQEIDRFVVDR